MADEIEKTQDAVISVPAVKEIKRASAEEVAQVNDDVLSLDCSLHKANEELDILNSSLSTLESTLEAHAKKVSVARTRMHRILPKL